MPTTRSSLESGGGMSLGNVAPRHSDFECHARFACGPSGAMEASPAITGVRVFSLRDCLRLHTKLSPRRTTWSCALYGRTTRYT